MNCIEFFLKIKKIFLRKIAFNKKETNTLIKLIYSINTKWQIIQFSDESRNQDQKLSLQKWPLKIRLYF